MNINLPIALLVSLLPAATLSAQRTWIVDAAGGGDFTDLPVAVAAAAPGDVLLVRSGSYSATSIARGLLIAGDPGAAVGGRLQIQGVPVGETCVIAGIRCDGPLSVGGCAGRVHLEGVRARGDVLQELAGLQVDRCHLVSVNSSAFSPGSLPNANTTGARIIDSTVSWTSSSASGGSDGTSLGYSCPATPALEAERSTLYLTNARLAGGQGLYLYWFVYPGGSGLVARDCTTVIAGDARTAISGGETRNLTGVVHRAPDVSAQGGSLTVDLDCGLASGGISSSSAVTFGELDAVVASSSAPGGTVQLELISTPGAWAGLLLSLPADPMPLPPLGDLWLDLGSTIAIGATVMGSASWSTSLVVPATFPRAIPLVVQARVDRGGVVSLSTPAVFAIR